MNKRIVIGILLYILIHPHIFGQEETYIIEKTSFSSDKYDEYCPVFYREGLVFSANISANPLFNYSNSSNRGVFNIFYTEKDFEGNWLKPELFSKEIKTRYNDGPCAFSSGFDTIYFSRNLYVDRTLKNNAPARNKLGIFYSTLKNNEWDNVRAMRINNEWYNLTSPYLSPDGKKLYFASDNPDGHGGLDLYVSDWKGNYWSNPVNLGPVINTEGNEAYPFVNQAGELFFSSDGHGGLGAKDIFFTRLSGDEWISPIHIDSPVNSAYDDFGIIADPLMKEGYFSSNRDGTVDIYHFYTLIPQVFHRSIQKENQYCFVFEDSGSVVIDTNALKYVWAFSDGKSETGSRIIHCFPGPGDYEVRLDIVEKESGRLVCHKLRNIIHLKNFEQPYIDSPDCGMTGEILQFSGLESYLPGYEILNYAWDFGDGTKDLGFNTNHVYPKSGEYEVNLGLELKSDSTGKLMRTGISKNVKIFSNLQQKIEYEKRLNSAESVLVDVLSYPGAKLETVFSVEENLRQGAVFRVELLTSENRISNNRVIRNVPSKYMIDEVANSDSTLYSYFVEWQLDLMATYPAYKEMHQLGFDDVVIKAVVLTDPPEKDLYNLRKIYSTSADRCFNNTYVLTSHALIMLDQVVNLMNRYPEIKLEVGVHTDSSGADESNLGVSQRRADTMVNYLINRGIRSNRLYAVGYGETKPIAPNYFEHDRKRNRRVELRIVND
ncbi:MAG TPA: PKD domain-containing protein [Bacteroidetes bacterium]|nr:PKD domain-containing protein [Bacteroidota bacterium]